MSILGLAHGGKVGGSSVGADGSIMERIEASYASRRLRFDFRLTEPSLRRTFRAKAIRMSPSFIAHRPTMSAAPPGTPMSMLVSASLSPLQRLAARCPHFVAGRTCRHGSRRRHTLKLHRSRRPNTASIASGAANIIAASCPTPAASTRRQLKVQPRSAASARAKAKQAWPRS